jgi:hypothetical protein
MWVITGQANHERVMGQQNSSKTVTIIGVHEMRIIATSYSLVHPKAPWLFLLMQYKLELAWRQG